MQTSNFQSHNDNLVVTFYFYWVFSVHVYLKTNWFRIKREHSNEFHWTKNTQPFANSNVFLRYAIGLHDREIHRLFSQQLMCSVHAPCWTNIIFQSGWNLIVISSLGNHFADLLSILNRCIQPYFYCLSCKKVSNPKMKSK